MKTQQTGASAYGQVMAIAESVLKPLFGGTKAQIVNLQQSEKVVTFEADKLPEGFKPQGKVLSEVRCGGKDCSGERSIHWIVRAGGRLIRLAAFKAEAQNWLHLVGAIYTGENEELALSQALAEAKRFH